MSLQDEMRARALGQTDADAKGVLPKIRAGGSLTGVRAESGANLLLVYLLTRWGRIHDVGAPASLAASESFQDEVVDTYLAAGCVADEAIAARDAKGHLPRSFIEMGRLPGQVSALSLVELLRAHVEPWSEALAAQLERLHGRLSR